MNERRTKVEPYRVECVCEFCDVSKERESTVYMTHPVLYRYTCPQCGHTETSHDLYPRIEYEPPQ